jgi:formylglycine-generating enzyme
MKRNSIITAIVLITSVYTSCLASCPAADLTGDCFVDLEDFAILASQWLTTDPCVPQDMAYIRGGTFQMGDSFNEGGSDSLPVHTVTLSYFYIGKHDITNQQYCSFLNSAAVKVISGTVYASTDSGNSYPYCDTSAADAYSQIAYSGGVFSVRTKGGRSMVNDPMVCVSWFGAAAYCNWRSQQEGREICYDTNDSNWPCDFSKNGYHLPTEAQWEYAARGGLSGKRFPLGDTISRSQANYYSNNSLFYDLGGPPWGYDPTWGADGIAPYTSPVGSFLANGYGLYDMAGNVWQLCNDWYSSTYYSSSPPTNPKGPTSGMGMSTVLRGGGWVISAYSCRVTVREYFPRGYRGGLYGGFGFRVSMDLN